MKYFKTRGVCATEIGIELDENHIIKDIKFVGGCHGNTQGLEHLVIGEKAETIINKLQGINCKNKGTSCPDQLSQILTSAIND